jgi:hypothetical protein
MASAPLRMPTKNTGNKAMYAWVLEEFRGSVEAARCVSTDYRSS